MPASATTLLRPDLWNLNKMPTVYYYVHLVNHWWSVVYDMCRHYNLRSMQKRALQRVEDHHTPHNRSSKTPTQSTSTQKLLGDPKAEASLPLLLIKTEVGEPQAAGRKIPWWLPLVFQEEKTWAFWVNPSHVFSQWHCSAMVSSWFVGYTTCYVTYGLIWLGKLTTMDVVISVGNAHSTFSQDCLKNKLLKYNLFVSCGLPVFNTFLAVRYMLLVEEDLLETV